MLNGIIHWSVNNRWVVNILAVVWFGLGIFSIFKMPVDVFPDFAPIQVVVLTEAPGFAPEEVEMVVTRPLEVGMNGTANVQVVRSVSTIGLSVITVIFQDDTNIFTARQLVAEKLQVARSSLPTGVKEPVLAPITSAAGDVLKIGLYSNGSTSQMDLRTLVDWTIKMRFLAVSGVSNVVVTGGEVKQYQILVDPNKLRQYDLTLAQVLTAAGSSSVNAAGGMLRTSDSEQLIRGLGRVSSPEEIGNSIIATKNNVPVLLKNVATVQLGPAFKIGDAIVDGHPGVILTVFKQPWANTLETTVNLEKALEEMKAGFPNDVKTIVTFRQADFIEVAVKNVGEAVILGGVLVVVILFLFLRNWRTALISLTAIPLSLLSAIICLKMQGYTINTMTLGGLAIAIGEVVDDAIIDVENVYRRLRENKLAGNPKSFFNVVYEASVEVRSSVVYATFIVGLVFLPVLSLGGLEGKIFSPLAYAYLVALFSSLGVALTVTPSLCYILLASSKHLADHETSMVLKLKDMYRPVVNFSLNKPKTVLVSGTLLFVFSLIPLIFMGTEFLPEFDENNLIVVATSMPGTSLETTTNIGKTLIKHFIQNHEVVAAGQRAGRAEGGEDYGAGNFSEYDIRLKTESAHKKDVMYHVRHEFAHIPGLIADSGSYLQHRMEHVLSGVNAAIAIKIFGTDLDILHEKAKQIEAIMKTVNGAVDVHVEPIIPVPQIAIKVNRTNSARYGITVKELSTIIEAALKGTAVAQVLEGQKTFEINVWFKPEYRNNVDVIKGMLVDTSSGIKVPLTTLADVTTGTSPNTISHEAISRRVFVQANVSGRDLGSVVADARKKIQTEVKLPTGYYIVYGGEFEAQEKAMKQLFALSVVSLFGMLILLCLAFKSIRAAILIMANLPLSLIGGIWAVFFTGAVMSVGSMVGFITLFGISTRNGIMLIAHFNDMIATHENSLDETIRQSALDRLSPVLMTALTAALGVLPIAVLGGAGRELEQPLAIVILGGMVSSTALTLVMIPALLKLFGAKMAPIKNPDAPLREEGQA
ncbi:MAG: efflux RND transporter permease subunit [Candidatus Melainabacteria bacterium]|nr:efflux RND transporter permease subunit [Candidatus Melainabacteria bacterium]